VESGRRGHRRPSGGQCSTTFGSVDAKAIYAIKGTKTVLLVASAPLSKVEAYASSLLG